MNPTTRFLTALGQTLAAMTLYAAGHPVRVAARERSLAALQEILAARGPLRFSFLQGDVIVGTRVLHELRGWDWGAKLANAGVQRLEIDAVPTPTHTDMDVLLEALHERLTSPNGREHPPIAVRGLRAGPLAVLGSDDETGDEDSAVVDLLDALAIETLDAEMDTVRWIHEEVANTRHVPMAEVETVIHSLASAMHRDHEVVLPLLELKTVDQYTTTHACNVAMLSMGLAEHLGIASADVRAIGMAALLHDIGKVSISPELLTKSGALTPAERAEIERHPVEGARILSARGRGNDLAAVVAYEHHIWENGRGGYPMFAYPRRCHFASRLVHVCDLYDALSTQRPYRAAWPRERTLAMLQERSGVEVDAEMVRAFLSLSTRAAEARIVLPDPESADAPLLASKTA
jgi:putative nucleotidyltransferase with HDIG domain